MVPSMETWPCFPLRLVAAGEILVVSISLEASRITETNWRLNSKLVVERAQRRCRVQGTSSAGRASEALLEGDADDCHDVRSAWQQLAKFS